MIRDLVAGVKQAFGLGRPGRRVPVRPDDILLASYPKSGSTWLRLLIANLRHPDREVDYANLHQLVLDLEVSGKRDFDRASRPRIIKTHGSFDPRYRRVIYVVRDPRDVALSHCEHLRQARRSDDELAIEDFIERFLTGKSAASRVSTAHTGSWGENVGSWLATRSRHSDFLLVRFEDLLDGTARELTRVADFAGLPTTAERISQAVERSVIERSSGAKMRKTAKPGGWRSHLPEAQVARIEDAWGGIMACLGYELVTRDPRSALKSSLIGLLMRGAAGNSEECREVFAGDPSSVPGTLPKPAAIR
ncbi:MAG: sulfotransferase domain-containing protein [Acidobacteriia bacterium]|nr:sulfotransferase domain-containing protein [Terriglobia bacterium]